MINAWSENARKQLEDLEDWIIVNIDLGEYGEVEGCFDDSGRFVIHDESKTELEESEVNEIIDFALGNMIEHECFWYEGKLADDEPIDAKDYCERYANYEQMSDLEINKSVADAEGLFWYCRPYSFQNKSVHWLYSDNYCKRETEEGQLAHELPNYCNSWADMGPLLPSISEDLFSKPDWCLLNRNLWEYHTDACDGNMCRAAAIVYLMSKGG